MKALLRKDLPWIVVCTLSGGAALTTALLQHHLNQVFAFGRHLDWVFHTAWIAGLVLGLVAATFDECLGTREFLRQRPVSPARVHAARVVACGLVLLVWFVAPVLLALVIERLAGYWSEWPVREGNIYLLGATQLVAVSACGIGLWTGALPVHVVWRVLFGTALLFAGFGTVEEFTEHTPALDAFTPYFVSPETRPTSFLVGHLLLAGVCVAGSFVAAAATRDDDQPVAHPVRWFVLSLGVVAAAVVGSCAAAEVQTWQVLRLLFRGYPEVELRGDSARLVRQVRLGKVDRLQPVDAQHAAVGEPQPHAKTMELLFRVPLRGLGFDSPRWEQWARGLWRPGAAAFELTSRGDVLVDYSGPSRSSSWTGKGDAHARFAPGSWIHWLGDGQPSLVVEPAPGGPWRVDEEAGHFVPVPLPEADRILDYWTVEALTDNVRLIATSQPRATYGTLLARGEHTIYVVGATGLRPAPEERAKLDAAVRLVVVDQDPIAPRAEVQDGSGRVRFAHDYSPHTDEEIELANRAFAAGILLRPPLLLGLSHVLPTSTRRSALIDPIVAGGRRPWVVLGGLLVGCLAALLCTIRLRRLGAPRATWQYWALLNVLLGPAALFASIVFERPRAYRVLPPPGAIEPPRIVTQPSAMEVTA